MLSDALIESGAGKKELPDAYLKMLTYGCISTNHAGMFLAYIKQLSNTHLLSDIIKGERRWPSRPEERDVLYFLAQSFRGQLMHELPKDKQHMSGESKFFVHRAKALIKDLSTISNEIAQLIVAADEDGTLPEWFLIEIIRDLPRLAVHNKAGA